MAEPVKELTRGLRLVELAPDKSQPAGRRPPNPSCGCHRVAPQVHQMLASMLEASDFPFGGAKGKGTK